mmetsp:Transcript_71857/g.161268  ORF Transcript_71857/g.161268 Transcript_71857/m.161268 type:complete len:349 (+) Transcript_71857:132-1178(+)
MGRDVETCDRQSDDDIGLQRDLVGGSESDSNAMHVGGPHPGRWVLPKKVLWRVGAVAAIAGLICLGAFASKSIVLPFSSSRGKGLATTELFTVTPASDLNQATCGIAGSVAAIWLARVGITLDQIVMICPHPEQNAVCAVKILGVLHQLLHASGLITNDIAICDAFLHPQVRRDTKCAAQAVFLVDHSIATAQQILNSIITCPAPNVTTVTATTTFDPSEEGQIKRESAVMMRQTLCAMAVTQVPFVLTLSGLNFARAADNCAQGEATGDPHKKELCAAAVMGASSIIIRATGWMMQAASKCAPADDRRYLCADDVLKAIGRFEAIIASALGVNSLCPFWVKYNMNLR